MQTTRLLLPNRTHIKQNTALSLTIPKNKNTVFCGYFPSDNSICEAVSGHDCDFDTRGQHCKQEYQGKEHGEQVISLGGPQGPPAGSAIKWHLYILKQQLLPCHAANLDCLGLLGIKIQPLQTRSLCTITHSLVHQSRDALGKAGDRTLHYDGEHPLGCHLRGVFQVRPCIKNHQRSLKDLEHNKGQDHHRCCTCEQDCTLLPFAWQPLTHASFAIRPSSVKLTRVTNVILEVKVPFASGMPGIPTKNKIDHMVRTRSCHSTSCE